MGNRSVYVEAAEADAALNTMSGDIPDALSLAVTQRLDNAYRTPPTSIVEIGELVGLALSVESLDRWELYVLTSIQFAARRQCSPASMDEIAKLAGLALQVQHNGDEWVRDLLTSIKVAAERLSN